MSSFVSQSLYLEVDEPAEGIMRWRLNRPEAYNALNLELLETLASAIEQLKSLDHIRVLLIQGNGRGFSAGHDLKELTHLDDPAFHDICFRQLGQIAHNLHQAHQIVIACVHGHATAGGCLLASSCDIIIAEQGAKFSVPGINVGLFCFTPMIELMRNLPAKIALEMLVSGKTLTAKEAKDLGFVNRVVAKGKIDEEGLAFAQPIARHPFLSISDGKRSFYQLIESPYLESMTKAKDLMLRHFNSQQTKAKEAAKAMMYK